MQLSCFYCMNAIITGNQTRKHAVFGWLKRHFLLVISIVAFSMTTLHQLSLPGLYYDEALDLVPMLDLAQGRSPELLRGIGIGRFPLMLLDYMGSLGGYVALPFVSVFGAGFVAARIQPLLFSALTIALVYALATRWFGARVAGLTALLLAVQPSFVWFSRQGISVTSVMSVFAWGSLLLLTQAGSPTPARAAIASSPRRFALAGACLGLGLWAKLPFLWWLMMLGAMAVIWLLTRPDARAQLRSRARGIAALVAGFALGAAPLLAYNLIGVIRDGSPHTASLILGSLLRPTQQFGVDNRDFLKNLGVSWSNFSVFIDGSYFWYNGVTFSNTFALPTLAIALLIGLAFVRVDPRVRPLTPRWLALACALPVAIVMGAFTVSGQWATHFFIISGVPQMLIACAAVWMAERVWTALAPHAGAFAAGALALGLVALPLSRDVWVNAQHHAKLAETGGSGRFSDAVYAIAEHLDQRAVAEPVALDWGIEKQIRVLTGDRVRPIEIFGYSPDPNVADAGFADRARGYLKDPNRRYIVLWDRFAVYNRRAEFTRIANEMGKTVTESFIAHERSGLPVYVVLEAR
jgi:hypothetical protein